MAKKLHDISLLIQFNTGKKMSVAVQRIAWAWKVNHSEVCKRLAVLAALGFDVRHHDPIAMLAEYVSDGNQPFVAAAHQAAAVLDENSARELSQEGKFKALVVLVKHNEKLRNPIPAGFES